MYTKYTRFLNLSQDYQALVSALRLSARGLGVSLAELKNQGAQVKIHKGKKKSIKKNSDATRVDSSARHAAKLVSKLLSQQPFGPAALGLPHWY